MDNHPLPEQDRPSRAQNAAKPPQSKKSILPHGCLPTGFAALLLFILVGMCLPVYNSVSIRGPQTKALAQAKQVGLALKLFAGDNDGQYPKQGVPTAMKDAPRNSNDAFAPLFPTYTQSESIFGNKLSAYQTGTGPDNVIDRPYTGKPVETLRPGENVYGYVEGLNDADNPNLPLVLEGTDGSGHYNTAEHIRGGTWKEKRKAVVIRLDNSGMVETLHGPDNTLYIPQYGQPDKNLLDPRSLPKGARYLDPAVAGP